MMALVLERMMELALERMMELEQVGHKVLVHQFLFQLLCILHKMEQHSLVGMVAEKKKS
jgi:hypothetical protein